VTSVAAPKIFGTGLIALDLVVGIDPQSPVRAWAGGTCGNVLSILAYVGWDSYPIARMNGDPASDRVRADMARWGVRLDFASCGPTAHTPIIIQEIRRGRDGRPKHRFSWSCPQCGQWLPGFKAVTVKAVEVVRPALAGTSVFFLDRLSRAALTLAAEAAEQGAVVVFEPSGKASDKMLAEAVRLSHVIKYASERLSSVPGAMESGAATLVEVQTLGEHGLQYRHRFGRTPSKWRQMDAVVAPRLADTCGSGDWCTAGLIAKAAVGGLAGVQQLGEEGIRAALQYGQMLAAWNCGFEGARGGMYSVSRAKFEEQITALLAGRFDEVTDSAIEIDEDNLVACPACPPVVTAYGPTRPRGRAKRAAA
jgi:fructokinase